MIRVILSRRVPSLSFRERVLRQGFEPRSLPWEGNTTPPELRSHTYQSDPGLVRILSITSAQTAGYSITTRYVAGTAIVVSRMGCGGRCSKPLVADVLQPPYFLLRVVLRDSVNDVRNVLDGEFGVVDIQHCTVV